MAGGSSFVAGFLSQFATEVTADMEEKRKENEGALEARLRLAAQNKLKYDEDLETMNKELMDRKGNVDTYLAKYDGVTDWQRAVLYTDKNAADMFIKLNSGGQRVDLNKFLVRGNAPEKFDHAAYTAGFAKPEAKQTSDVLYEGGIFGTGKISTKRQDMMASKYGGTAGELLAYEGKTRVARPEQYGGVNVDYIGDLTEDKSMSKKLDAAQRAVFEAQQTFGKDSPEYRAAANNADSLYALMHPKEQKPKGYAELQAELVDPNTAPSRKAQVKAMLNEWDANNLATKIKEHAATVGSNTDWKLTPVLVKTTLRDLISTAVEGVYNNTVASGKNDWVKVPVKDNNGDVIGTTWDYTGSNDVIKQQISELKAKTVNGYVQRITKDHPKLANDPSFRETIRAAGGTVFGTVSGESAPHVVNYPSSGGNNSQNPSSDNAPTKANALRKQVADMEQWVKNEDKRIKSDPMHKKHSNYDQIVSDLNKYKQQLLTGGN